MNEIKIIFLVILFSSCGLSTEEVDKRIKNALAQQKIEFDSIAKQKLFTDSIQSIKKEADNISSLEKKVKDILESNNPTCLITKVDLVHFEGNTYKGSYSFQIKKEYWNNVRDVTLLMNHFCGTRNLTTIYDGKKVMII